MEWRSRRIADRKPEPPEAVLRRKQVAGLLLIAFVILVASVWRAGLGSMFPPGWWRIW